MERAHQADGTNVDLNVARALGWASLGIAATEIFGQGRVETDVLGIEEHPQLLRALGAREATSGLAILSQDSVTPALEKALWSRVAGDAMDLALLAGAARRSKAPAGFAIATLMVAGITALDVWSALRVRDRLRRA